MVRLIGEEFKEVNVVNIEQMRYVLKHNTKYRNSAKWANRVNMMPDNQVTAVYFRMLRSGEILK